MQVIEQQQKAQDVLIDVICDCCGKSCNTEYGFEVMKLSANWGYMSNKDLENWEADVCEKCVDEKLSFIKFNKKSWVVGVAK